MKTTSIILLIGLSLSIFGSDARHPPKITKKKEPTKKELRLLLRSRIDLNAPLIPKPINVHDGMLIVGSAKFVGETKEALNRMKKQAPAIYDSARRHVKVIKHHPNTWGASNVSPWKAWGGTINITDRDCLYDNYGFWFDSVICHEMQHQDWGDAKGVVGVDFSAPLEPAARWAHYIIPAYYSNRNPAMVQYLRACALGSGYSQYKWENRYNKLSCK
tara:strand:- start:777 stop:1427 length:651 start_codon:yes stop_codon:yes gene_type:complete